MLVRVAILLALGLLLGVPAQALVFSGSGAVTPPGTALTADDGSTQLTADDGSTVLTTDM